VTTTDFDAWQRAIKVRVVKPGDPLALESRYEYDATGRLERVIQKQNGTDVITSYAYDVMGRRTSTTTNNIATVGAVTTSTVYDLSNRRTVTMQPGGATSTTEVDSLGRPIVTRLNTGSSPIEQRFAYDLAGNRVYATDLLVASATAYDSHGRAIATRGADGTITTVKHDESGQPTEIKALDPTASETVSESNYTFSIAGRLESMKAKVDGSTERSTTMVWDGGGRTTGTATGNRATRSTYDIAGRPLLHASGAGSATALSEIFAKSEITAFNGSLPATTESSEKNGPNITTTVERDTAGSVKQANTGSLEWKQKYDELGNVTEASAPGRPAAKWDVDARGAVKQETLPDGAQNQYAYNTSGAQTDYTDPTSEATSTVTDLIGRPTSRTYADGTSETIMWKGARLESIVDRQGREQSYVYNAKGQLEEIRSGAAVLDRITYDSAGRMVSWKTPDTEVSWGPEFDLEGRPKRTRQRRFRDGSGLTTEIVLDEFEQQHVYNEHGERTFASMPRYPGLTLGAGWTKGIAERYDAMGNVILVARAEAPGAGGAPVLSATYRNAGRPDVRTIVTAGGSSLTRNYAYDPTTGQLASLTVANANGVIAGSEVTYDGLQKASARLLGLASGERYQHWSYDARSRVSASLYGVKSANADPEASVPGRATEELNPADFRNAQSREPALDSATRTLLAEKQIDATKIDPPTASFTEQSGHKVAEMTKGPQVRPFAYQGAERIDDGRFTYEFDVKGRLIRATEKTTVGAIRSIAYSYSGMGRLVGRRAEYSSSATAPIWRLEDRPQILAADGLPADTTFVWDPITDRLVSIFKAGATTTDAHGGLLKQIIHGDSSYDDPLETATIDPVTGAVTHLYPIYDEAGGGSLQAIVNTNGQVVARNLSKDPYGAEDVALAGAAVDGVKIAVKKTNGTIDHVTITLHATEELSAATIATGARLAAVDANGAVVRTTPVTPLRVGSDTSSSDDDDRFALQWTLTASQWTTLTAPTPVTVAGESRTPTALSIAATSTLRATNWSADLPLLPAPTWATASKPVFTSSFLPVEVRESLTALVTLISTEGDAAASLYEIDTLALLGNPSAAEEMNEDIVSARMHAHPFTEPMTHLNYLRARWFDPEAGTFLTPDPLGYEDSSNLYAFAGGDPVNARDPSGELCERANASGFWDWAKRCGEDIHNVQDGYNEGIILHPVKTAGRAVAGFVGTGKMIGKTAIGLAEIAVDTQLAQLGDTDAQRRHGQRIGAVIDAVLNPIDTIVGAHSRAADKILEHEQKGEWFQGSIEAGDIGAADAAAVVGAIEGGISLARVGNRALTRATSFLDDFDFNISPLSDAQLSQHIPSRAFRPHGNSLSASGPHDVYAIIDRQTRQVYHFGETGRGWQVRGAEWVRKLKKEHGLDTIAELLRAGTGKTWAKALETRYIDTYTKAFGRSPHYVDPNGSVVIVQKTRH
jgi:RHS repeat-associated protein